MHISPEAVVLTTCKVFGIQKLCKRQFQAKLGVDPALVAELWEVIDKPDQAKLKHLIWCLYHLKPVTESMSIFLITFSTFLKWMNVMARANLKRYKEEVSLCGISIKCLTLALF